jgi:hypothetical protein
LILHAHFVIMAKLSLGNKEGSKPPGYSPASPYSPKETLAELPSCRISDVALRLKSRAWQESAA